MTACRPSPRAWQGTLAVFSRHAMLSAMNHASEFLLATQPSPPQLPSRRAVLGQFFTPAPIAKFMASLFSPPQGAVRLLDAGGGEGALTEAFIGQWQATGPIAADVYEIDEAIIPVLTANLAKLETDRIQLHPVHADFIDAASGRIGHEDWERYNRAILNPPYRKIATSSRERLLCRAAGLETVNLYSAFVGLALELLEAGGELVAIIPRSFCNGPYYRPFRKWLFARAALKQIHLFDSRRSAFAADDVLQENVIIHLVRDGEQGDVRISTSSDAAFLDQRTMTYPSERIVAADDPELIIHIPTDDTHIPDERFTVTLDAIGLTVATGPVVDFRMQKHLHAQAVERSVPLLYPHHMKDGRLTWPIEGKKPNAIAENSATHKWLVPKGWYVLVKRFSSKEERRRVVATLVDPSLLPGDMLGIDNKLNLLRQGRQPLPEMVARGLAAYLNTSEVDRSFRLFSGHTQVNASDLRRMKFPTLQQLETIGRAALASSANDQDAIDACVAGVIGAI